MSFLRSLCVSSTLALAVPAFGSPQLETVLSGAGWLRDARAVAVDDRGNAYVGGGSVVIRVAPDGTRTTMIDAAGNIQHYMSSLIDLAPDSAGNLYVLGRELFAYGNNTVFKVAADGTITFFDIFFQNTAPWAVVIDSHDNAYVLAWENSLTTGNRGVLIKLSPDGSTETVMLWAQLGGFPYPAPRITIDGADNLYLANRDLLGSPSAYPIQRIAPDGTMTELYDLGAPAAALATDGSDNVYAVTNNGLVRITPAGDATTTYLGSLFGDPVALSVDAAGNAFVVSDETDNVIRVAPDGTTSEIIGPAGDGLGHPLTEASDVAVGPDGSVFVTGFASRNAFSIGADGTVAEIVDEAGDGAQVDLARPDRMTTDAAGNLYVCGIESDNVFRLEPNGDTTELIDATGDGSSPLEEPWDVAVDSAGSVFVVGRLSDNAFRVKPNGAIVEIISSSGDGAENVLDEPLGVAVDPAGNAYVVGYRSNNVFRIATDGTIVEIIDELGGGTGSEFRGPSSCAVDPLGNVWVTAFNFDEGSLLFRIDPSGYVTTIPHGGGDIAVGSEGNVYAPLTAGMVRTSPSGIASQFGGSVPFAFSARPALSPGGDVFGSAWNYLNSGFPPPEYRSVFRVSVDGTVTELLGADSLGPIGLSGPVATHPLELAVDPSGDLYLAHQFFHTVSRLSMSCEQLPSVTIRNAGTNPPSYTVTHASIGGTLDFTVNLATTGHDQALVIGFDSPFEFTLLGGQTLLCLDLLGSGGELINTGFFDGPLATTSIAVPPNPNLIGFTMSTQAVHAFGVVPFALSNAQDVVIGGCP